MQRLVIKRKSLIGQIIIGLLLLLILIVFFALVFGTAALKNPYAEEAVLFVDSLNLPFIKAIQRPDYGYPAVPVHLLWRLSWIASGKKIADTVIFVRIITIALSMYLFTRTFFFINPLLDFCKPSTKILLYTTLSTIFILSNAGILTSSFHLPYLTIPFLLGQLCRNCISPIRMVSASKSSKILLNVIDNIILYLCCLSKPLLWPLCLAIGFSQMMNTYHLPQSKERRSLLNSYQLGPIILFICFGIFLITLDPFKSTNISIASPIHNTITEKLNPLDSLRLLISGESEILIKSFINLIFIYITTISLSLPFLAIGKLIKTTRLYRSRFKVKKIIFPTLICVIVTCSIPLSYVITISDSRFYPTTIGIRDWVILLPSFLLAYLSPFLFRTQFTIFQFTSILKRLFWTIAYLFSIPINILFYRHIINLSLSDPFVFSQHSTFLDLNHHTLEPSKQRCYYPGPENWNSPYINTLNRNCQEIELRVITFNASIPIISLTLDESILSPETRLESLVFKLDKLSLKNNPLDSFSNLSKRLFRRNNDPLYSLEISSITNLNKPANSELIYSTQLRPNTRNYQFPIDDKMILNDPISLSITPNRLSEDLSDYKLTVSVLNSIKGPRVQYSSKFSEAFRLPSRIDSIINKAGT